MVYQMLILQIPTSTPYIKYTAKNKCQSSRWLGKSGSWKLIWVKQCIKTMINGFTRKHPDNLEGPKGKNMATPKSRKIIE